ncbi:hypothetical protein [Pseudoxanthomonas putridarboris]|uniref:Secreted protein n=1 Tax=Pseudoxanthomonas putridarboris TaxID=752605 RepID=A0ABU9IXH7_9GAMM
MSRDPTRSPARHRRPPFSGFALVLLCAWVLLGGIAAASAQPAAGWDTTARVSADGIGQAQAAPDDRMAEQPDGRSQGSHVSHPSDGVAGTSAEPDLLPQATRPHRHCPIQPAHPAHGRPQVSQRTCHAYCGRAPPRLA